MYSVMVMHVLSDSDETDVLNVYVQVTWVATLILA